MVLLREKVSSARKFKLNIFRFVHFTRIALVLCLHRISRKCESPLFLSFFFCSCLDKIWNQCNLCFPCNRQLTFLLSLWTNKPCLICLVMVTMLRGNLFLTPFLCNDWKITFSLYCWPKKFFNTLFSGEYEKKKVGFRGLL